MDNINGTKTERNLMSAFAGECQAKTKYEYYATKADEEGYKQIAAIFTETAGNEREHGKLWYKFLNGGVGTTEENLKVSIVGEKYEWVDMYAQFAKEAREEGFDNIAFLFEEVGKIEREHQERYQKLLDNIQNDKVFEKDEEVEWICSNCGHIHKGKKAQDHCEVCGHPRAFAELVSKNY